MDEDKLRTIVKEVVNEAVDPIRKQLDDPETGLAAINRRLDANTAAVTNLESTVNGYGEEKRLEAAEENANIAVSPELQLEPLSQTV